VFTARLKSCPDTKHKFFRKLWVVMRILNFLVESFIATFGITRPRPEQQRTVALALGGFLLLFFTALVSLITWMLFGVRR
jgi:hypothetical protein